MPDAIERQGMLAWLRSTTSRAEKHPNAFVCQVIAGNVTAACRFTVRSSQPPNRRV
jgi:hypothetical protein